MFKSSIRDEYDGKMAMAQQGVQCQNSNFDPIVNLQDKITGIKCRLDILESHMTGLYEHFGLTRVRVIEETYKDLRELITKARIELRKIIPDKSDKKG